MPSRLDRRRELNTVPARLSKAFADSERDLARITLQGLFDKDSKSRKQNIGIHYRNLDATLKKHKSILTPLLVGTVKSKYELAVSYASQMLKESGIIIPEVVASEIHLKNLQLFTSKVLDQYGKIFDKAGNNIKRIFTRYADGQLQNSIEQSLFNKFAGGVEKAPIDLYNRIDIAVGREQGTQALARDIFKSLNDYGVSKGDIPADVANMVSGKFINVGGRNYRMAGYSETVAQASISTMSNEADIATFSSAGIDVVQIDSHDTTSEVCQPFEGTLWSLSGESKKHRALSECLNGGPPFHPRCSHWLMPVIDEIPDEVKRYRENSAVRKSQERLDRYLASNPQGREVTVFYEAQ